MFSSESLEALRAYYGRRGPEVIRRTNVECTIRNIVECIDMNVDNVVSLLCALAVENPIDTDTVKTFIDYLSYCRSMVQFTLRPVLEYDFPKMGDYLDPSIVKIARTPHFEASMKIMLRKMVTQNDRLRNRLENLRVLVAMFTETYTSYRTEYIGVSPLPFGMTVYGELHLRELASYGQGIEELDKIAEAMTAVASQEHYVFMTIAVEAMMFRKEMIDVAYEVVRRMNKHAEPSAIPAQAVEEQTPVEPVQ